MDNEKLREVIGQLISESMAFKRSIAAVSINLSETSNAELAKETLAFHLERFTTLLDICKSELY